MKNMMLFCFQNYIQAYKEQSVTTDLFLAELDEVGLIHWEFHQVGIMHGDFYQAGLVCGELGIFIR